jgi:Uncharacterized protein conserved in bacteria
MNHSYKLISALLLLFAVYSCTNKDEEQRPFPRVKTLGVSNITDEGAVLNGYIDGEFNGNDVSDHGFCYGYPDEKAPLGYTKVSLGKLDASSNSFHAQVSGDLLKDKTYSVMAFVELSGKKIYGTPTSFISKGGLGPEIKSFKPQTAGWGDTIKISGRNFSAKMANNMVKFDQVNSTIIYASDTLLKVIVPLALATQKSMIGVTTAEKTFLSMQPFLIGKPIIKKLTEKVSFGGTLNIKTQNVNGSVANFYIDGNLISATQISLNDYNLVVPKSVNYGTHKLKISVFSENVENNFHYDAPYLSDFVPKQVVWNNKLTVKGKNFKSIPGNTRIDFQASECSTYNYSILNDSVIQLKVPECVTIAKCKIGLVNDYFSLYSSSQLLLAGPELQNFQNNIFCIGDYVTLVGKRIKSMETKWLFDGKNVELGAFFEDSTHVKFYIPEILDAGAHKLKVRIGQLESNEIDFSIKKLVVKSIAEDLTCRSGRFTIYGENFARYSSQNVVKINDVALDVIERTDTYLKVKLPYYQSFDLNPTIVVKVGAQEVVVPDRITVVEPWEKVSVFDGVYSFGARFTIGNKFYFSSGNLGNGEFYCFNGDNKSLKRIADYPGGRVMAPVCFVIGEKAYVGLGHKDSLQKFWSYDPASDSWSEIADCPLPVYIFSWNYDENRNYAFVNGQIGYVGDFDGTIYKYNPGTNQWSLSVAGNADLIFGSKNASFSINNHCYLLSGSSAISIREFSPTRNSWEIIKSSDYAFVGGWSSVIYHEKSNKIIFDGYFLNTYNPNASLKYYDFSTDKFGFFFPSSSVKATLFTTGDGRLFSMTYNTNTNQLLFQEFNFSKYEQIKSLIDGNE